MYVYIYGYTHTWNCNEMQSKTHTIASCQTCGPQPNGLVWESLTWGLGPRSTWHLLQSLVIDSMAGCGKARNEHEGTIPSHTVPNSITWIIWELFFLHCCLTELGVLNEFTAALDYQAVRLPAPWLMVWISTQASMSPLAASTVYCFLALPGLENTFQFISPLQIDFSAIPIVFLSAFTCFSPFDSAAT